MERFKEKEVVLNLNVLSLCLFLISVMFILTGLVYFPLFEIGLPFVFLLILNIGISNILSDKSRYTREFINYILFKLDKCETLEDYYSLKEEFESLAMDNREYRLNQVSLLKIIHDEIDNNINSLQLK